MSVFKNVSALLIILVQVSAFRSFTNVARRAQCSSLQMSDFASQVLAAQPTIEEWLDVAEPGLKKATLAMFRSVKEVSYKMRTASFGTKTPTFVATVDHSMLDDFEIFPNYLVFLSSLILRLRPLCTKFCTGDEELSIDIMANNVIFQNLRNCGSVVTASSAETLTEGLKRSVL